VMPVPNNPPVVAPSRPQPMPATIAPVPATTPSASTTDFATKLGDARKLLNEGKLIAARQAFVTLAQTPAAPRSVLLEAAQGLSETSAWYESSAIYVKLFPLKKGEEKYYLYEAINRYELGELSGARDFLARALPYVQNNRELAMYRSRIEATQ
jgi:hypothetical protein